MPHVASLISQTPLPPTADSATSTAPLGSLAEDVPLFLPSSLPPRIRCLPELVEVFRLERRLREPQARDALAAIQRQRRIIQGLWQFKQLNAAGAGNRPNTKMVTLYKRFDAKCKRAVQEYRTAWCALLALDPTGSWSISLKELKNGDIRGPGKDDNDPHTSNSRYEPSWIWLVTRVAESSSADHIEDFNNSMRVEWAKSRARMLRWKEEELLVQEEMRRVLEHLSWKAEWWRERRSSRTDADPSLLSGISGYANKQADICLQIAQRCASYWLPRLKAQGIAPSWASKYDNLPDVRTRFPFRPPGKSRVNREFTSSDHEDEDTSSEGSDTEEGDI